MLNWEYIGKIDGWLTEGEGRCLYKHALSSNFAIEIGSWKGRSTCCIANGIMDNPNGLPERRITAIDHFKGSPEHPKGTDTLQEYNANLTPFRSFNEVLNAKSDEVVDHFADNSIDLLFIDGEHSYAQTYNDFTNYFPTLKSGGIIIMHDVYDFNGNPEASYWPDCTKAYKEILEKYPVELVEKADRQAVLRKLK